MEQLRPPAEILPFGLRALKMVAIADGSFAPTERRLLEAAQRLYESTHDLDTLEPIAPEELAAHVVSPSLRRQLVRAMVIVSLADGEASPSEAVVVERFAKALGISSPDLTALRHLADDHLVRARFDIARRFWAREKAIEAAKARGLGWLARSLAVMAKLTEDEALAARYRALGDLPAGTLGHSYFDFVTSNGFSFPGERGSAPEIIVLHDLTHVLSGYATDPDGELEVLSFHAGCRREEKDPFAFLLFGLAEFQLGIALTPIAATAKGRLDPERMLRALQRGAACKIDPTDGWDPWPVMHTPLDALRAEYGISPR